MILLNYEQHLVSHEVLQLELNCVIGEDILPEEKDWEILSNILRFYLHNAKMDDRLLSYHATEITAHIKSKVDCAEQNLVILKLECHIGSSDVDLIKLAVQNSKSIKSVIDIGK
ncbi:MAG: hypothetical protein ABJH04_07520 [Cyclobacteriaceae bacterium]